MITGPVVPVIMIYESCFSPVTEKRERVNAARFLRVGFTLSKKLGNHSKRWRMPILSFLLTFPEATPEKVEKWHEMNS